MGWRKKVAAFGGPCERGDVKPNQYLLNLLGFTLKATLLLCKMLFMLTMLIIANPADASQVGESQNLSLEFDGLDAKGINQVKLGTLYAILAEEPYNPNFMAGDEAYLYAASDEGPYIQLVPGDLVHRVANLATKQTKATATEWSKAEEFDPQYSNWTVEQVEEFLGQFVSFCKRAVESQKSILMWMSL